MAPISMMQLALLEKELRLLSKAINLLDCYPRMIRLLKLSEKSARVGCVAWGWGRLLVKSSV
ncbi:uncharacterized protein DS421_17g574830 [Arachis hypogaea]|nr:uncharacterized protein DS421_17g574830 [Arachis hypogaea]